jgi:hypothetical protein
LVLAYSSLMRVFSSFHSLSILICFLSWFL